jgi:Sulfotransferase family
VSSPSSRRPIIILGVERSGTSLVSELASRWGAYGGDPAHLLPPGEMNPQGFFEYRPLIDFLIELHGSAGVSEWYPPFDDVLHRRAFEPRYREPAVQLVAGMETAGTPWFWKEPYLCLSLSFWENIWNEPIYVVVFRNPHDSARSYERFVVPELKGQVRITAYFVLRWQHFMLMTLEHAERNPAKLFVRYEQLLRSPAESCERLCEFLDRQCAMSGGAGERLAAMTATINPGLWRNKQEVSFLDLPEVMPEQKALFRFLEAKTADPLAPFDPAKFPLPAFGREYLENFGSLLDHRHASRRPVSTASRLGLGANRAAP